MGGSYLGSYLAYVVGLSDLLAPLAGLLAAELFAGDPLGIIWTGNGQRTDSSELVPETLPKRFADAA